MDAILRKTKSISLITYFDAGARKRERPEEELYDHTRYPLDPRR